MKFIRAELHNHSTESDGALSVESLAAYAAEKNFGVLALTDHNTTSGHAKAYDAIRRAGYALALLPGVEITTFFGHILALGLVQMPDITTLDPRAPEPFFEKFYLQMLPVSHIIIVAPAGVMELVDVADSKDYTLTSSSNRSSPCNY